MTSQGGPVACFSYLAAAELWHVADFPRPNHGAQIQTIEQSVAADGPMVTAVLAALDRPSLLLANDLGEDQRGAQVRHWLAHHQVPTTVSVRAGVSTPHLAIVGDDQHTRTMFLHLPDIAARLADVDLSPIASASFVYVDCYTAIQPHAIRAIQSARTAGLPLLANLGGDMPSRELLEALDGYPRLIVQSSITNESPEKARQLAAHLQKDMQASWAILTAGAAGAAAADKRGVLSKPAFRVAVRHTHCAGAAFSGGLLHGLLSGLPMEDCLELACASGALRCERGQHASLPTLTELRGLVRSRANS